MAVTRDDVLHDRVRQRLREDPEEGNHLLSEEAFEQTRADMLAEYAQHDELWVFGYGSLIWNPTFEFVESAVAHLTGYTRSFCLWANTGRGSHDLPGLWLGLDEGHACTGMAFRIDNQLREFESLMLWRREMVSGAYVPSILPVEIDGRDRPTLCLLSNKQHVRYAANLSEDELIHHIACAEGHLGTCREYLFRLVHKLHEEGINDAELEQLAQKVEDYRKGMA